LRVERLLLGHVGDARCKPAAAGVEVDPVEADAAAVGLELPGKGGQQCALSAATGADDAEHFAPGDLEVQVVERPALGAEGVLEVAHPERADHRALFVQQAFAESAADGLVFGEPDQRAVLEFAAVADRRAIDQRRRGGLENLE